MGTGSAAIESVNGERLTEPAEEEKTITFTESELEFIMERVRQAPFSLAVEVMQFIAFKLEGGQPNA